MGAGSCSHLTGTVAVPALPVCTGAFLAPSMIAVGRHPDPLVGCDLPSEEQENLPCEKVKVINKLNLHLSATRGFCLSAAKKLLVVS